MHLGERDKALDWSEKGMRAYDPYTFYWVPILPEFDSLRSDPRYQKLVADYGLTVMGKLL
jgi:hypothetical protein